MKNTWAFSLILTLVVFTLSACDSGSNIVEADSHAMLGAHSTSANSDALGKGRPMHIVSAGTHDANTDELAEYFGLEDLDADASLSFVARMAADGTVTGQYSDVVKNGDGGTFNGGMHGTVDCMIVDGNTAILGGVITHALEGSAAYAVGRRFYTSVRDNGTSKSDPADQISFTYSGSETVTCDYVQNVFIDQLGFEFPYFSPEAGQVTIR